MRVTSTTVSAGATAADTIAAGVFDDEDVAAEPLQALLDAGEARRSFKHLALTHADRRRLLLVGLGAREDFDAERARVAAATVVERARELGTRVLCWESPGEPAGLVEGTVLAAYRFDGLRTPPPEAPPALAELIVASEGDVAAEVEAARIVAEAQNAARDLANTPANLLQPATLAERARALAEEHPVVSVEAEGRDGIVARGMGAFAAVAQGADAEPQLITLRYDGGGGGPLLGLVGKAVTFDSGGYSIKPAGSMAEMKYDMAGGAAVLEAVGAIARLGLPVRVLAVVGATENLVDGGAMRPGDVVRTKAGLTIEVNNTDAEGRLVLADCLAHAVELGAERLVDVATLTGAIRAALGRTYAGLLADDDGWAAAVQRAGDATGELLWRLPLHPEYAEQVKGTVADLSNAVEGRMGGAITAAALLARFTGDVPWAHLDIVGTAWNGGRAYAPKAASGFGVRLLVELARATATE